MKVTYNYNHMNLLKTFHINFVVMPFNMRRTTLCYLCTCVAVFEGINDSIFWIWILLFK